MLRSFWTTHSAFTYLMEEEAPKTEDATAKPVKPRKVCSYSTSKKHFL